MQWTSAEGLKEYATLANIVGPYKNDQPKLTTIICNWYNQL